MFLSQHMWLGTALVVSALATLGGVAMLEHSPLLALSPLAPFALVLGGLFLYSAGKGEAWALSLAFAMVFFVFAVDWRADPVQNRLTDVDAVVMLKFAMFILALMAGLGALNTVQRRLLDMPTVALLLIFMWSVFTAIFSHKPDLALVTGVSFASLALFAITINERIELKKLVLLLMSTGSIYCLGSLVAFFFFPSYGQFVSFNVVRLTGLATSTNESGQIAALTLISVFAFYLSGFHREGLRASLKCWIYVSIAAATAVLVLSDSRGALASVIVAAIAVSVQRYRILRAVILVGVIAIALTALAFLLSPKAFDIANEFASGIARSGSVTEISSFAGRADIWSFSVDYIADNPVIGAGFGQGAVILRNNYVDRWGLSTGSAHNAFLQMAMDLGVVGAVLLAVLFAWSIKEYLRNPSPFRDGIFIIVLMASIQESSVSKVASTLTLVWLISIYTHLNRSPVTDAAPGEVALASRTGG